MKFPYELIAAKRDGGELKANEIDLLVNEYTAGRIKDYQFAAFLMAVFINGLSEKETAALTGAMLKSGKTITISGLDRPLIDKHSTGGVGDKLSLVIAPLLAECGIAVGMISGRGLGHTGGTLDKLEAIPGMKVFHSSSAFARLLKRHHFAITGQTANIVPADRKIYALRNVTGTVESIPLIVASIMSKKLALKSDGILFDVKTGSGAFMKTRARAIKLAQTLLAVSRAHNLPARAIITQMNQPTGRMIGNFLEIVETVAVLQGGGPPDTIELAVELAAQMLLVAGQKSNLKSARRCVSAILESGQAYENLCRYVADCGGAVRALARPELVIKGIHKRIVKSPADGYLSQVDTARIGFIAASLGAGRLAVNDRINPVAGIELKAKIGDKISRGEPLAVLYAADRTRLRRAVTEYVDAITISETKPTQKRLVIRRIADAKET